MATSHIINLVFMRKIIGIDPGKTTGLAICQNNQIIELFTTDFSENEDYDYPKPGARARITFTDLNI